MFVDVDKSGKMLTRAAQENGSGSTWTTYMRTAPVNIPARKQVDLKFMHFFKTKFLSSNC